MWGLMDQPTWPTYIRESATHWSGGVTACSSNRCSTSVGLSVVTKKRSTVSCGFVFTLDFPMIFSWFIRCEHYKEYRIPLSFFLFPDVVIVTNHSQGVVVEWCRFFYFTKALVNLRWCNYHGWFLCEIIGLL